MNAFATRNARLTAVAVCPVGCPVAIPTTTMNTAQQRPTCAARGSNWDGTLPVSRDHFPTPVEAKPTWSGGRHE